MQHAQGSSCNEFVKYLNGLLISESLHLGIKDAVRVDKLEPSKNRKWNLLPSSFVIHHYTQIQPFIYLVLSELMVVSIAAIFIDFLTR